MAPASLQTEETARISTVVSDYLNSPNKRPTVATLAKQAATGPQKLREYFREWYGMPVQAWFHAARLRTAQLLLRNTSQPIKAVGLCCGYSNYKNFLTAYRKFIGESPTQTRRGGKAEYGSTKTEAGEKTIGG